MSSAHQKIQVAEFLRSPLRSLPLSLPWVFALFAVPLVIFLAVRTPAFQSPDEQNHFYRSWQIAHGGFFARGGGNVDSGIEQLNAYVANLPFNSGTHITAADAAGEHTVPWSGQLVYRQFQNTSAYFPACYIPQALAILIGRAVGVNVFSTLILARILNAATCIAISSFALSLCRRGKIVIFAVLMLPMTLSLFASSSQDALLIALACLAFSLISRQLDSGVAMTPAIAAIVSALLLIISLARPTNAALALVFFVPGLFQPKSSERWWIPSLALTGVVVVLTTTWWGAALRAQRNSTNAFTPYPDTIHIDPKLQLAFLLNHPHIVTALLSSVVHQTGYFIATTVGDLGYLDTPMPAPYYFGMLLVLAIAILAEFADGRDFSRSAVALILCASFFSVAGVFLSSYLLFSPVGSEGLYGVQGRYFIPLAIAAAVGLPCVSYSPKIYERATAIVVLAQLLTVAMLPHVVLARYYGG
jgi:uncharacterized membrane protein